MDLTQFKREYGENGLGLRMLVQEFIARAPEFKGDKELARALGEALADLESALNSVR